MRIGKSHIKSGLTKTLLIILGVIIALIMTMNSPLFTAEMLIPENQLDAPPESETSLKAEETSSGGMNYNSGTRLLHIFTKNLPYLNNK